MKSILDSARSFQKVVLSAQFIVEITGVVIDDIASITFVIISNGKGSVINVTFIISFFHDI